MDINLNEMPSAPEDLQEMFEKLENGEDITPPEPERQTESASEVVQSENGEAVKVDEPSQPEPQDTEEDIDGVATKDGKHVIPYSVLKGERERASRAEQILRETQERMAAIESQLQAKQGAKNGEDARALPQDSDISDEELESLKEDFPTVYKAFMFSKDAMKAIEGKLAPVEESMRGAAVAEQKAMLDAVQEAIDEVPKMAFLQANDAGAFELAKQFDEVLRTQQAWAGKPLAERFAKVIEMVEGSIGKIDLPGETKPSSLDAGELSRAARAKVKESAKQGLSVPSSLSDFPAGTPPAQDEQDAVEQMTHQQLAAKFARMSADEMDAYFRSL